VSENPTYYTAGSEQCNGTSDNSYGADNRVAFKDQPGSCHDTKYWTDQAGNRLGEEQLAGSVRQSVHKMSYTAAGQLYFSLTPTLSVGHYDVNWHWYDPGGKRVISQRTTSDNWYPDVDPSDGRRTYYVYDGADVAMTVVDGPSQFGVRQRFLVGGVDQPLLALIRETPGDNFRSLALIGDRQGSTVAAVKHDGNMELNATFYSTDAFGAGDDGGASPGDLGTGTGFTGASTPNQNGGFVYLRNRWYDPNTGRFLTQDPIGLAGGVNLYAYAGNNPVAFSDPFGLCAPKPECWFQGLANWGATRGGRIGEVALNVGAGLNAASEAAGINDAGRGVDELRQGNVLKGAALIALSLPTPAGKGGKLLKRFGTAFESAAKLGDDAARAVSHGLPHGVSFTSHMGSRTPGSVAAVDDLVGAGFDVIQTGGKGHYTVVLPEPVTDEIAQSFNSVLGRVP